MPKFRGKAEKIVNSIMSIGQSIAQSRTQLSSADLRGIREHVNSLDKSISAQIQATETAEKVKAEQDRIEVEKQKAFDRQNKENRAKAEQDE